MISELANQARLTKPFADYRERLLEMWSELPDELNKQQKAVVNAIYQVFKYNMKIPPPMIRSLINDIETPKPQTYGSQDFGVLANDPLFSIKNGMYAKVESKPEVANGFEEKNNPIP